MLSKGCRAITIDEETFELLREAMIEYDCDSVAESVEKSATVAPQQDEAELAQISAKPLEE